MNLELNKALQIIGGQRALARILGIRQQSVAKWKKRGKVPPLRAKAVVKAAKGKISLEKLCPDIYAD